MRVCRWTQKERLPSEPHSVQSAAPPRSGSSRSTIERMLAQVTRQTYPRIQRFLWGVTQADNDLPRFTAKPQGPMQCHRVLELAGYSFDMGCR